MRHIAKIAIAVTSIFSIGIQSSAQAGLIGAPQALRGAIQRIKFDTPAMTPMAFTFFCIKYADECKPRRQTIFRGSRVKLNAERWAELNRVNREVNTAIRFERNNEGLRGEKWLINPATGDCNDYAVSKRHQLMARGWSSRSLLLSEVVTTWGEHHLVLVVRTDGGDLVLDNIGGTIVPWSKKSYQWLRIQTPKNPSFWASLGDRNA
jgi:predicted transglutaminase-like cysteine proteinase